MGVRVMSVMQYSRFVLVGAFVALITVTAREVIGGMLGADTPLFYSISVVLAYAIGIVLSFLLNRKFTFHRSQAAGWPKFLLFIAVALLGMLFTWLISLALRYGITLGPALSEYWPAVSFAMAALLTSGITYPLNTLLIFRRQSVSDSTPETRFARRG